MKVKATTALLLFMTLSLTAAAQESDASRQAGMHEKADHAEMHKAHHPEHYTADAEAVRAAVLDYAEGIYEADAKRIARSVSRDLVKFGYWRPDADTPYRAMPMNYEQLYELAETWNAENKRGIDESTVKEVVLLDVMDQTAAAKLTAMWGVDYFQLEKVDGRWMIRHVMWQSPPA